MLKKIPFHQQEILPHGQSHFRPHEDVINLQKNKRECSEQVTSALSVSEGDAPFRHALASQKKNPC